MDIATMEASDIHLELKEMGIKVHHKTGIDKLRSTLTEARAGTYSTEEAVTAPVAKVKAPTVKRVPEKLTKEQRALRLIRIVVSPNDPLQASYPGLIFTVGSSAVKNGKMIKKYVPFNNDEGWHVPNIIYEQINNAEMQKFKSVKLPNGEKGLQAYITKKFNVQVLPPLTQEELDNLAASQKARGDS